MVVSKRRIAIVEAPSALGLQTDGVALLPQALLDAGLAQRLGARHAGRVEPPPRESRVDPLIGVRNARGIVEYALSLGRALSAVLDAGEFPVVLGGDCSILLGALAALRERGRYGLLFLDGHADFYSPQSDPLAEAASMELAFATGRGPELLTDLAGRRPLVGDEDVAVFGFRDGEEQAEEGAPPLPEGLRSWDLPTIRQRGIEGTTREAVAHVARPELDGFWIHVDADVLDDAVMPAVDYRLPGGLSAGELSTVLSEAIGTGAAVGLTVTIYNPQLDPDGSAGSLLADVIARGWPAGSSPVPGSVPPESPQ